MSSKYFRVVNGAYGTQRLKASEEFKELPFRGKYRKTLLDLAIDKWETIVHYLTKYPDLSVMDGGPETCALCRKYHGHDHRTQCVGCPVFESTGKIACYNTPFVTYVRAKGDFLKHAQAEVDFLKGLRK